MDTLNTRPTWFAALLPLLAVWQYGDRGIVRGELYRMALSADAAAQSAEAFKRIVDILDRNGEAIDNYRDELRAVVSSALLTFEKLPPCAPVAMVMGHGGRLQ